MGVDIVSCFSPLKMFRSAERSESGKRPLTNNPLKALNSHVAMRLPCGACNGCRADKRKQWAMRVLHEAQMHSCNLFLTLTLAVENRPASNSLAKRDLQLFHMRVREHYGPGIKHFACGEMGESGDNPHYHSILMADVELFDDKTLWVRRSTGPVWKSATLERLWPKGLHEITGVTVKSAAYVAGYVLKKLPSPDDPSLVRLSPVDGQWHTTEPEFATMSRRPGLGSTWFDKFQSDAFPSDFLIIGGKKVKPPKYYLDKLKVRGVVDAAHARPGFVLRDQGDDASQIVKARRAHASSPSARANSTPERLAVRAEKMRLDFKRSNRSL
jgi:hypothetical protein